jgi:hypothetical protein
MCKAQREQLIQSYFNSYKDAYAHHLALLFLDPPMGTCDSPETIEECVDSCKSAVVDIAAAIIDQPTGMPVDGSILSTFMELSLLQGTNAVQAGGINYIDSRAKVARELQNIGPNFRPTGYFFGSQARAAMATVSRFNNASTFLSVVATASDSAISAFCSDHCNA